MLSQETTIGIYPNGELQDVLIVPDGYEYHLFHTGEHGNHSPIEKPLNLGSIIFVNGNWIYEGNQLSKESQTEIADFIFNYPDDEVDLQPHL